MNQSDKATISATIKTIEQFFPQKNDEVLFCDIRENRSRFCIKKNRIRICS